MIRLKAEEGKTKSAYESELNLLRSNASRKSILLKDAMKQQQSLQTQLVRYPHKQTHTHLSGLSFHCLLSLAHMCVHRLIVQRWRRKWCRCVTFMGRLK